MRVLVVGDLSVITIFRIARLPQTGSNVVADGASIWVSGVAANLACVLRGLGAEVAVVGAVGADVFGRNLVSSGLRAASPTFSVCSP